MNCVTISLISLITCSRFESDAIKENLEQGKSKYQEFKAQTNNDNTGPCWTHAIQVGYNYV